MASVPFFTPIAIDFIYIRPFSTYLILLPFLFIAPGRYAGCFPFRAIAFPYAYTGLKTAIKRPFALLLGILQGLFKPYRRPYRGF